MHPITLQLSTNNSTPDINRNGDGNINAPHLDPAITPGEAARAILNFQYQRLLANEAGTMRGDDAEAVHEMRVAARRLEAALRDFRGVLGKPATASIEEDVHWLAQHLGGIRDLDVFLEWLEAYTRNVNEAEHLLIQRIIEERQQARDRERRALVEALQSPRYHDFKNALEQLIATAPTAEQNAPNLRELAATKIARQLKRVFKRGADANLKHLKRLHQLRLDSKRLRYSAEFFASVFPEFPAKLITRANAIQDTLGVVHDSDVQIDYLRTLRRAEPAGAPLRRILKQMMRALRNDQARQYRKFRRTYRRLRATKFRERVNALFPDE